MRHLVAAVFALLLAAAGPVAQKPSAAQLARAGWEAINGGRLREAATTFDEALRLAPQEPTVLLGAAMTAHLQGRSDAARRYLIDALRVDPALTPGSLLLGEVLYRSGDLDGAIATYERALQQAPGHAQITKKLEAWGKESALHSRFGQRLGDHFTVLFEGPAEAALADRAVQILEAAFWRIGTALATYPTDVVSVVLYTREQFRDITQSPAWAGGAFDGRIRVPVQGALQNVREFERVLSHEFTHALVRSVASRGVPVWLNEGLAVQFEGSDLSAKREQVRSATTRVPLSRLERSFEGLATAEAGVAYAESAVAVQALLDLAGTAAVVSLLGDIGRGMPFDDAFLRNILMPYSEFQKKLLS